MLILITTVGILVLIYSDDYMSHDVGYLRFFIYISFWHLWFLSQFLPPFGNSDLGIIQHSYPSRNASGNFATFLRMFPINFKFYMVSST
jgi:hypothetical protein